jgi:hypothetical protein
MKNAGKSRGRGALILAGALAVGAPQAPAWADNALQLRSPFQVADSTTTQRQRSQPTPEPSAPEPQRFSVAVGGLYTHREGETAGWAPNVEVDYAATDRLLLHFMAPYAFDRLSGGPTHFGIGDVEVGARYRFIDEDPSGWRPAVAVYPLVNFPTGSESRNLGTGRTHVFLPLWLSKTYGAWTPYGGGGYWINPGPNNKDWVFADVGVLRRISDALTLGGEIFYASSSKVGLKEQTGFDVNGRYNFTDHHHLLFSIGRGIQNASVTNELTAYLAYLITF